MEATEKNFRIADEILLMLEKNLCTVQQATDILAYVSARIRRGTYDGIRVPGMRR